MQIKVSGGKNVDTFVLLVSKSEKIFASSCRQILLQIGKGAVLCCLALISRDLFHPTRAQHLISGEKLKRRESFPKLSLQIPLPPTLFCAPSNRLQFEFQFPDGGNTIFPPEQQQNILWVTKRRKRKKKVLFFRNVVPRWRCATKIKERWFAQTTAASEFCLSL